MILRQTAAIFLDAYRELHARKMFWLTLVLSALVVAVFGIVGLNAEGISILWWTVPNDEVNTANIDTSFFYKQLFVEFGIGIWLAWAASILALVSTAPIFPDFLASGAIELTLSKPIGRARLFFTKYLTGLMFVFLQVLVFAGASFLVIGARGGVWEPGIFLAIPVMVLFFSFLFSICVLLGVATRSTIPALMLTILLWFIIFLFNATDGTLLSFEKRAELSIPRYEQEQASVHEKLEAARARLAAMPEAEPGDPAAGGGEGDEQDAGAPRRNLERQIARGERYEQHLADELASHRSTVRGLEPWVRSTYIAKTVLPKTQETIGLLKRWMIDLANLPTPVAESTETHDADLAGLMGSDRAPKSLEVSHDELARALESALQQRSVAWVLGTSLGFEAVMLALAAWVFCRRDY